MVSLYTHVLPYSATPGEELNSPFRARNRVGHATAIAWCFLQHEDRDHPNLAWALGHEALSESRCTQNPIVFSSTKKNCFCDCGVKSLVKQ